MKILPAVVAAALLSRSLAAQSLALDPGSEVPPWLQTWSALYPRGDLPRTPLGAPGAVPLLMLPTPRVGLFWSLGNPAALGDDLPAGRTDFVVAFAGQRGRFRRPLDPADANLGRVSALGWRQLTPRLALLGRLVVDRETDDPSSRADFINPYDSSPLTVIDTTTAPMRRDRIRLEGASQWTFGDWRVGLTLGYETRELRTLEAGVARSSRRAMPGGVLGISRRFGDVTLAAHGAIRVRRESYSLRERSFDTFVNELQGYRDVRDLDVIIFYNRRLREWVPAAGVGLAGRAGSWAWALGGERVWRRERQSVLRANDPPEDRWDAEGWRGELMLGPDLHGDRVRLLFQLRYHTLDGRADVTFDSAGVIFTADERLVEGRGELRLLPGSGGWTGVLAASVSRERRTRVDSVAGVRSDIIGVNSALVVELGHTVGRGLLAATAAIRHYRPTADIPDPTVRGTLYQSVIGPELAFASLAATPVAVGALGRYAVSPRTALWTAVRYERVSPTRDLRPPPLSIPGSRTGWSISGGVSLTPLP